MSYRLTAILLLTTLSIFITPLQAGEKVKIEDYINDIPGIGLILDEVDFDGIKLRHLTFLRENEEDDSSVIANKYVITQPGKTHKVAVDYELNKDVLENFQVHHLIFGLYKNGPQGCLLHSLGLLDRKGTAEFEVTAPEKPGVYQLRFCHATGLGTFEDVKEAWWKDQAKTAKTIMGIVVVQ